MEQLKKRKRVLAGFCVFLAFMWLCTIISKSIYASKLPQVSVKKPQKMAINHDVKAEGIVEEGRELAVNVEAGLRVHTVYAHVGDKVTEGTLLFDLDIEDLQEIIEEKQLQIKKQQLQIRDLEQNKALAEAVKQKGLNRANEDYNRSIGSANTTINRANEDLGKAQAALNRHRNERVDITPDEGRDAAWAAYEKWVQTGEALSQTAQNAQKAYDDALKNKEVKQAVLDALREQKKSQGGQTGGGDPAAQDPSAQQPSGNGGLQDGGQDGQAPGNTGYAQGDPPTGNEGGTGTQGNNPAGEESGTGTSGSAPAGSESGTGTSGNNPAGSESGTGTQGNTPAGNVPAGEESGTGMSGSAPAENGSGSGTGTAGDAPAGNGSETGTPANEPAGNEAGTGAPVNETQGSAEGTPGNTEPDNPAGEGDTAARVEFSGGKIETGSYRLPLLCAQGDAGAAQMLSNDLEEQIKQAEKDLEAASSAVQQARQALEAAEKALQEHMKNAVSQPDFSGEDAAQKSWVSTQESLKGSINSAERGVQDAYAAKDNADLQGKRTLEDASAPSAADSSLEISRLELQNQQKQLKEYQQILANNGQVTAEADGVVTGIRVSSGERTADGAALTYADLTSPLQFLVNLTKDQKKYVNQDDKGSLQLGSKRGLDVNVDYVAQNDNSDSYQAVINLEEGVGTIGQSGTLTVEAQSENYGCCIPMDAIHEENGRNYVYVVGEKDSILGKELAAEKLFVTILDKNEKYAAIEEGVIDQDTEVIVSASDAFEDRDVIRYQE